eukprot:Rhum_TRINITY_DN2420_c0_g1::Rhum_TRINITY_DN2420_c0_g1_i1::g.7159::m.7159
MQAWCHRGGALGRVFSSDKAVIKCLNDTAVARQVSLERLPYSSIQVANCLCNPLPGPKGDVKLKKAELRATGNRLVIGVDESGNYRLSARSVVACAAYLPQNVSVPGVCDSKLLSGSEVNDRAQVLLSLPGAYFGVGTVRFEESLSDPYFFNHVARIRAISSLQQGLAKNNVDTSAMLLLIDGNQDTVPSAQSMGRDLLCGMPTLYEPCADKYYHSPAAASIIASFLRAQCDEPAKYLPGHDIRAYEDDSGDLTPYLRWHMARAIQQHIESAPAYNAAWLAWVNAHTYHEVLSSKDPHSYSLFQLQHAIRDIGWVSAMEKTLPHALQRTLARVGQR